MAESYDTNVTLSRENSDLTRQAIAIVGMGMRLPGHIHSSDEFWEMLVSKKDGRCPVPRNRYNVDAFFNQPDSPKSGYFLADDPACFDADFFHINPLEAERMDPQQRLLLEVIWECLENAGETEWMGKDIGCYVGVFGEDWLELSAKALQQPDRYHALGTGQFALANRVSHEFDLHGPSMTIQTGCSASMVGLHEACRALQMGDCSAAIVAGTNLIWTPTMTKVMDSNGVLSPTGTCRTFGVNADGYGRGEAINALYLKRLDRAIHDQDRVRAVIRSTAVNADGRTPTISHPNALAQEAIIKKAYAQGGITNLHQTALVECHGTGTVAGDSVEMSVISKLFGDAGVILGGVKPNVGHSEGASGLTSIIKATLALEHREIPPNIHFGTPNPDSAFKHLQIPQDVTPWPKDRKERVSVNCFGIGGSNGHAILESAASVLPSVENDTNDSLLVGRNTECDDSSLLLVSAHSEEALHRRIRDITNYINQHPSRLQDTSHTLARRRKHLEHRAFVIAHRDMPLDTAAFKSTPPGPTGQPITFTFTGQGAQWVGMAKELLGNQGPFSDAMTEMDLALQDLDERPTWSIKEELAKDPTRSRIHDPELTQPLCTAIQVGLVRQLSAWGVEPQMVVGHSSGEIAAAFAAGAITAASAISIAYYRGKVASLVAGQGTMAAVGLSPEAISPFLNGRSGDVVLACNNSPSSVTISGTKAAIEELFEELNGEHPDSFKKFLPVSVAYHSGQMSSVGSMYENAISKHIQYGSQMIPMWSTVTGKMVEDSTQLNAAYWRQNLESPVLFQSAIQGLVQHGREDRHIFIEIGPHAALAAPLRQIFQKAELQSPPVYVSTLIRNDEDVRSLLLAAAGHLFATGAKINISAVASPGRLLSDLPVYPWKHDNTTRYWREARVAREWRMRTEPAHELLGSPVMESTSMEPAWRNILRLRDVVWLSEHVIQKQVTYPGAAYIAMAGEAIRQIHGDACTYSVRNVQFQIPLLIDEDEVEIVTTMHPLEVSDGVLTDWFTFTVTAHDGVGWVKHCQGQVRAGSEQQIEASEVRPLSRRLESRKWYRAVERRGLQYGPRFQGLYEITADPSCQTAVAALCDPGNEDEKSQSRYTLHPVVIDQCLQLMGIATCSGVPRNLSRMYIPAMIEGMTVCPAPGDIMVKAQTWGAVRNGQCGDAVGFSGEDAVLSMNGAFLLGLDGSRTGIESDRLVCQMEWKADIDALPPTALLPDPARDIEAERFSKQVGIMALFYICATASKIRDVCSQSPHLTKWKDWMLSQADSVVAGTHPHLSYLTQWVPDLEMNKHPFVDVVTERLSIVPRGVSLAQALLQSIQTDSDRVIMAFHDIFTSEHGNNYEERIAEMPGVICMKRVFDNCLEILSEEQSPLELLMEGDVLTRYYDSQAGQNWGPFLSLVGHSNPALRVLEIGAGTGFATSEALKHLKSRGNTRLYSKYVYTDISPGFLAAAQERFHQEEGMEYQLLDITKDPLEQGYELQSFDLIIASNVLHATPSLRITLQNVHRLLAYDGRLLLHELCPELSTVDYVMGTLKGWWLGEGDGRDQKPYVSPERWDQELRQAGFTGAVAVQTDLPWPCQFTFTLLTSPTSNHSSLVGKNVTLLCRNPPTRCAVDIEQQLRNTGCTTHWISPGSGQRVSGALISLLDIDGPSFYNPTEEAFSEIKHTLQQCADLSILWVTVRGCNDPRYSGVHGLARTLRLEMSFDISVLEVECFEATTATAILQVLDKIHHSRKAQEENSLLEYEFLFMDGQLHTCRFDWSSPSSHLVSEVQPGAGCRLHMESVGHLETIQWAPQTPLSDLQVGEVEVDIHCVGLNFRDVMVALGLVGSVEELGIEGSGVVCKVGPGVRTVAVGDRVGIWRFGLFRSRTVVSQEWLMSIPDDLSFQDAAALSCVYLTAIYSIIYIGNLQKGQTILIHSAAGGVGQAALHLCQHLGAKIYATVGSEEKVQYLIEKFNIPRDHIFCSRDASFLPAIRRATGGHGVDLVLNSLAGELLHASWECVADFGTMIELGKRDFLTHGRLSMTPFSGNRTFRGVDLLHIARSNPAILARLMNTFQKLYHDGVIQMIRPVQCFEATDVVDAFRLLQSGTHIGKVVINMPSDATELTYTPLKTPLTLSDDSAYLLVGGLGGIGRAVCSWLVEHGARELVILSRTAGQTDSDKEFLCGLHAQGCQVVCTTGTVTEQTDVQRAISQCTHPLKGVVQLAMKLSDRTFAKMTYKEWMVATAPKMNGTWNIHRAVEDHALDFFVMFGSLAGTVGALSQANYAAGNTFLDALAMYRRQRGLTASVLNLGLVQDIGTVTEQPDMLDSLRYQTIVTLTEEDVLTGFELAIRMSPPDSGSGFIGFGLGVNHTSSSSADTHRLWGYDARFSLYKNMESPTAAQGRTDDEVVRSFFHQIDHHPPLLDDISFTDSLQESITTLLAKNLFPGKQLSKAQAAEIVIDSLIAIEIRQWLRRVAKLDISLGELSKAGTMAELSVTITGYLRMKYNLDGVVSS